MRILIFAFCLFIGVISHAVKRESQVLHKTTIADIAERAKDSVVNVASLNLTQNEGEMAYRTRNLFVDPKKDLFGTEMLNAPRRLVAVGSGFIIRKEKKKEGIFAYYVVTNHHVIEETMGLRVILTDETIHHATLVGKDPDTDIAVLKFEAPQNLEILEWGDSEDLRIGEWAIVLGNPYGLGGTSLTTGVISYLARDLGEGVTRTLVDNYIQTEAAMNPGNSGGPLLNLYGKVIGVNTSIITTSGSSHNVGFAVPSTLAKDVVQRILLHGRVQRAWLGTSAQAVNDQIVRYFGLQGKNGALITRIIAGSPAEKANLQIGDVVISINQKPIKKFSDLTILGRQLEVGKKADFEVLRHGKIIHLYPVMQEYKSHEEFKDSLRFEHVILEDHAYNSTFEFGVTSLTSQSRQRFDINDQSIEGVLISDVREEGMGEQFTLTQGDVILEINEKKVKTIDDVNPLIESSLKQYPERPVLFLIHREGTHNVFIAIDPPKKR